MGGGGGGAGGKGNLEKKKVKEKKELVLGERRICECEICDKRHK